MITYTTEQLDEFVTKLENGQSVICNDRLLDAVASQLFKDDESERANRYFRSCKSVINPEAVGTLDTYIASY